MANGVITSFDKPRLLIPGIKVLYGDAYKQFSPVYQQIYELKSSERAYEEAVQLQGVGMAEIKGQGQAIATDSTAQGFARRSVHQVWAKAIRITMEAFDDNLYEDQASTLAKELAKALMHAKETVHAAPFNNLTSTSAPYLLSDGKALAASDHPGGIGPSFSNILNSDFNQLALEDADIQIQGWTGYDGLRMLANIKAMVIPRQLKYDVRRVMESDLESGTANNDKNVVKDTVGKIIPWQFITDADSWSLLTDVPNGFVSYQNFTAKTNHYQDDKTLDQYYQMYERYVSDVVDPHCGLFSPGA
jgi:hypothetical protein